MSLNDETRIILNGKTLVVGGGESPEHMQRVADYINAKILEYRENEAYAKMSADTKTMLLELNIGDDYITTKDKLDETLIELAEKNKELYEAKLELEEIKAKFDVAKNQVEELQNSAAQNAAKIMKLETQLKKK
ncbi:MAG: cell division protein ZapA [Lachnospiraceae bacterium]|nr:cell division protein ZapA [Lachnospiraceae bacterium]